MTLPTQMQTRETLAVTPLQTRIFLTGTPKSGKSTLAAAWAPKTTLLVDTQRGTKLLEGEHYVSHVKDWKEFCAVVDDLVKSSHNFQTVVLDMVDDLWNYVDRHCAGKNAVLATASDDYGRSGKSAEGTFRHVIGRLLQTNMGVWFVSHAREKQEGELTRYSSRLDTRVLTYVQGACDFIFLLETLGSGRALHTKPSGKFEAGSRGIELKSPIQLDSTPPYTQGAKTLYEEMQAGLRATRNGKKTDTKESAS